MPRVTLTNQRIASATYPEDKTSRSPHYLLDTKVPGLALRVQPSGTRTFVLRYRTEDGRRRHLSLGQWGALTLTEARTLARSKLGDVAKGEDPAAERQAKRDALTVEEGFAVYLEDYAKLRKKSWRMDESRYRNHIRPHLGTTKIAHVQTADVATIHARVAQDTSGPNANRVLALASKLFAFFEQRGFIPKGSNPARGIERFREKPRERWIRKDEMPRLLAAIEAETGYPDDETVCGQLVDELRERGQAESGELIEAVGHEHKRGIQLLAYLATEDERVVRVRRGVYRYVDGRPPETDEAPYLRAFFWALLLTGARKSEALRLRWDDVDFERRELVFRNRKNGRSLTLPLSPQLGAVLDQLDRVPGNPHVFPSARREGAPLNNVSKAWKRICARAGLEDLKIHDLRRTAASWLAQAGAPILVVRDALGHSTVRVTEQVYAHLAQEPVRVALDGLAEQIVAARAGAEEERVG